MRSMMTRGLRLKALLIVALLALGSPVQAQAPNDLQVTPRELVVENPTLINLGFEWLIDGDANRNASVAVSYRRVGDGGWSEGMPLLRVHGERIFQQDAWDLVPPNMFAGSILDLEPGTGAFWQQFAGVDGQTFPPVMTSYTAVRLYGAGHVVAYNYIADFHDGIDIETYGNPDGSHPVEGPAYPPREYWDRRPVAIDFYNNCMTNFHDNAVEVDGGLHNIRVMRNVMVNSASHPMCNQPVGGGPVYWMRNIVYHAPGGSTRMTSGAAGVLYYNNTILTETSAGSSANVHWRNNLILGQNSAPAIFNVSTNTGYSSSDYNGFRPNPGAESSFVWNSPAAPDGVGDGTPASLQRRAFAAFPEYVAATGQDQHSVLVDYDVFVNVPQLDARDLQTVQRVHDARALDFRLRPESSAVDRGVAIPNVTDGFNGRAPDLGALEVGRPLPVYGPRTGN